MKSKLIIPSNPEQERFMLVSFPTKEGEIEVAADCLLMNGGPGGYRDKLYAIHGPFGNFSKCYGILWSAGEDEVLDDAADAGLLDGLIMKEEDVELDGEDELNCIRLGNASEPFDACELSIQRIPSSDWKSNYDFVYALGRVAENPSLDTWAKI